MTQPTVDLYQVLDDEGQCIGYETLYDVGGTEFYTHIDARATYAQPNAGKFKGLPLDWNSKGEPIFKQYERQLVWTSRA